ncbi:uncharacterized protein [Palaemon carinicauda]|uniref:uncharacterized protein n=1 Tax=Palaemon carinicauda TaxID=392227 RepID=UPI0035B6592B
MMALVLVKCMAILTTVRYSSSMFPVTVDDLWTESAPVIESVLTSTESQKCSLLVLTDGRIPQDFIIKIVKNPLLTSGHGIFEILQDREARLSENLHYIYRIRKSVRCLLVVLASDNVNFITSTMQSSAEGKVLIWPARVLLVTHLREGELSSVRKQLSEINGLVLVLDKISKRCNIFTHLPYSHRIVKLASWTKQYGLLHSSNLPLFPDKFDRLIDSGHMTVAGDDFPPHMKVVEFPLGINGPPHFFIGPLGNFIEILGSSINFTYTLVRPPDRAWGYLQPNGSWMGMVGMVFRKEVDFALGPFVLTFTRAQAVDYALPLVGDNIRIAAKRGPTEVDPWGFAMPLAPAVWGMTFASMAFGVFTMVIFSSVNLSNDLAKSSFMDFFRVLLQQDTKVSSTVRLWERILLGGWMVTILVLTKSYSGNLMSLLAVRYVPQPYQSLRAVLDDSSVTMLWEGGTAYVQVFMNAESGIYYEVRQSLEEGRITYVKSSEYAQAMDKLSGSNQDVLIIEALGLQMLLAEDFSKRGSCLFYLSKEVFLPSMFGLVVQKHSPLGPAIARRMSSVTESGLYTQWMKDAVPNSTACLFTPTKITVRNSLSVRNLWGMFVLLGSGYVLSLVTFALEKTMKTSSHSTQTFWKPFSTIQEQFIVQLPLSQILHLLPVSFINKFCVLRPLTTKRAEYVAANVLDIFLTFGAPVILQSDNGCKFVNAVTAELSTHWARRPRHPQSQGAVERLNGVIQDKLAIWMQENIITFGQEPQVGLGSSVLPRSALNEIATEEDLVTFVENEEGDEDVVTGVTAQVESDEDAVTGATAEVEVRRLEVGQCATLRVPDVDRCPTDPKNLLVVVMKGKDGLYTVIEESKAALGVGIFEAPLRSHVNSTISLESEILFHQVQHHLKKSPRCMTVVLIGDKNDFQRSFINFVYSKNLLLWQSKLLVLSSLPTTDFHHLGNTLSKMNSMLVVLEDKGFIKRLDDGANLTVVAEDFPPHVRVIEFPHDGAGEPPHVHVGPLVQFLKLLSKDINFNYSLIRPPDRSWGYLPPNGSWIGMVGMVYRHEVDFALGPFGITYDRAQAVDYTWPLVGDAVRISAKRGETEVNPWAFLMPLSPMVWAGLLLGLLVFVVLHILLSIPGIDTGPDKRAWIKYIRVFLQQDLGRPTKYGNWERLLLATWIIVVLVTLESYSGNLMSLLAVRYVPQPYQSLRAVLDDPRVTMVWEGGTAYVGYFMSAVSGVFKDVAESRKEGRITYIKATEYTDVLEMLVMEGHHVLIIEDLSLRMLLAEHFTKTGNCEFYMSSELFLPSAMAMITQKNSPLRPAMDDRIKALTESGLYNYWIKNTVPNSTSCSNPPSRITVESTLKISNIWGMFVMLGCGFLLSSVALCMEMTFQKLSEANHM